MVDNWRLISDVPRPGAWNMALDEAILESVLEGEVQTTLRLYDWRPACLSLGYAQSSSEVDTDALQELGWQLVRRPTGGRAILHVDELTYSVIGPNTEPALSGGVLESYRHLSVALLETLISIGIPASASKDSAAASPPSTPTGPVCFEVPSNYEIVSGGKKIIGSAQARRRIGVLQHGSLPLTGDLTRITKVLIFPDQETRQQAAKRLLDHAATAEMILHRTISWQQAANGMVASFSKILGVNFSPGDFTPVELERARRLVTEKYGNPVWLQRPILRG